MPEEARAVQFSDAVSTEVQLSVQCCSHVGLGRVAPAAISYPALCDLCATDGRPPHGQLMSASRGACCTCISIGLALLVRGSPSLGAETFCSRSCADAFLQGGAAHVCKQLQPTACCLIPAIRASAIGVRLWCPFARAVGLCAFNGAICWLQVV